MVDHPSPSHPAEEPQSAWIEAFDEATREQLLAEDSAAWNGVCGVLLVIVTGGVLLGALGVILCVITF